MKKFIPFGTALIIAIVLAGCEDKDARAIIENQNQKINELTNETMVLRSEIQSLKRQISENDDKISKIALYLKKKEIQQAQQNTSSKIDNSTQQKSSSKQSTTTKSR